jgi:hypothetical protein
MDMRKNNGGFIWAIHRLYGGVIPLCEEIGVDYNGIVSAGTITKYKAEKASKVDIDNAILNLFSSGEYVKVSEIQSDQSKAWIYSGAARFYGDWYTALRENGVKPFRNDNVNNHEADILRLYKDGKSGLEISRLIGVSESSIYELLKRNNVEADRNRYYSEPISLQDTMHFVKSLINQASSKRIVTSDTKRQYPLEWYSIKYHFGGMTEAVKQSGEYVLDKGVPRKWSKSYLLSQIKLGYQLRVPLNNDYLNKGYGCSATTYARKAFGSWGNAIKAAGINYEDIRQDGSTLAPLGHEFEGVLSEILTDLNVRFTRYDHDKYRPDFVINSEWIDAKLSQFTYRTQDANGLTCVDKYEPHCDKLTLVFLRGNKECDAMVTDKTRLVSVYKYVNKLPDSLRGKYYAKLNEIERKADAV